MVCRPAHPQRLPAGALRNRAAVLAMPGVTHVALVDTGVAVRAETFGQCIDAIRAMEVDWNPGSGGGRVRRRPSWPGCARPSCRWRCPTSRCSPRPWTSDFEFMFRSSAALEPYCAIADVRADRPTIWAGLKVPILAQQNVAKALGLPQRQGEGQRDHRRRLVRAQAVRRPRHRGGEDLEGDGRAGEADVAPRRRAAPGPAAPDGHLADPGHDPRRPGAQLRAAATPAWSPTSATASAR